MKIGILTLVNQLNYGGVLQAYALQRVLCDAGYDAEMIDYWLYPGRFPLLAGWQNSTKKLYKRIGNLVYEMLRESLFFWALQRRRIKTQRFIKDHIRMSPITYRTPDELSAIKGYDVIVVGSDQVWNYQWFGNPNPFLLEKITDTIRRVSYAASFGFRNLPLEYLKGYQRGLSKFERMSVREKEGVSQVRQWSGRDAEWVVDPTLLLVRGKWDDLIAEEETKGEYIFCYWLGNLDLILPRLEELSIRFSIPFRLYLGEMVHSKGAMSCFRCFSRYGSIERSAGPIEFLCGIRGARMVVSDSFHALMFSLLFARPVRIVFDSGVGREKMGARFQSFCEGGKVTWDDVFCVSECLKEKDFFPVKVSDDFATWRAQSLSFLLRALCENQE